MPFDAAVPFSCRSACARLPVPIGAPQREEPAPVRSRLPPPCLRPNQKKTTTPAETSELDFRYFAPGAAGSSSATLLPKTFWVAPS